MHYILYGSKSKTSKVNDRAIKFTFIGYIKTIKLYRCLELKNRKEHFIRNVVFHESTPYYEKELRETTSSSVPDYKKCRKSELEQEHEPIAAATKQTSATVARATQKPD